MNDLVRRRIELKYLLPAAKTRELRAVLTAEPGPHFRRIGGWVTTVYFDLPDRRLARAAMERPEENLKLRLREYFDDEGAPCCPFVWIEIKERQGSSSRKSRFRLHKRLVAPFLRGAADLTSILTCQTTGTDPSGVCETVQLTPPSSERKTRPAVVPNHARPPWLVMHSPLAAKAASPGRAAGICRPVTCQCRPPSSVASTRKCWPSGGSDTSRPRLSLKNVMQS